MSEGPIDLSVFNELQETTGSEFAVELVTTFLDEAPEMIADLKDAATQADADRFRRAAHSLKSNANVFGANSLAEVARVMEISSIVDSFNAASISALDEEYERTEAALRGLIDG